jgi:hypothetical protein
MELVAAMTTFGFLGAAAGALIIFLADLYFTTAAHSRVNTVVDKASAVVLRDVRHSMSVLHADAAHFKFRTLNDETIEYAFSSPERSLFKTVTTHDDSSRQRLFDGIDDFRLEYIGERGSVMDVQNPVLDSICEVKLSFTDSTDDFNRTVQFTTFLRNERW